MCVWVVGGIDRTRIGKEGHRLEWGRTKQLSSELTLQSKTGQGEVSPFCVHFVVGCKVLHASRVFSEVCIQLALSDKVKL